MTIKYLAIGAMLTLTSCTSIPEKRAERAESATDLPAGYSAEVFPELEVVDSLLDLFDNAEVNRYTQLVLENNPSLLRAYAQMEEAGFNFQKTRGSLFPSLSGKSSGTKSGSNAGSTGNTYSASLDARWEVDIWGELRNRTKASKADFATAEANYEARRQSLAAQTMQSWFELLATTQLLDLGERQLESFESTHRLVVRRYERGTATSTDVDLAHTDAASSRADYESRKNNRDQAARALKVLIGVYPDAAIETGLSWPKLTRTVPSGLPSELLLARPDIIAAYQGIRASDARARAAFADLFPSFTLTANGGRSSDTLSDLGRSAFDAWSLAGQIAAPIFEGGSRRAEVGAADQRAEQAYQNYRSVVLNSFREVEDALNSEAHLAREETARIEALAAARGAAAKSQRDYEAGLIELIDLQQTQRRVFTNEIQTINLRKARLSNRVSLALALGKGV